MSARETYDAATKRLYSPAPSPEAGEHIAAAFRAAGVSTRDGTWTQGATTKLAQIAARALAQDAPSPTSSRMAELAELRERLEIPSEDMIEEGCRAVYGRGWDGPPEKMPGPRMKEVWRDYALRFAKGFALALSQRSPPSETYNAADDSRRGYDLALRACREQAIRRGKILPDPDNPEERGWAEDGPCSPAELAAVRHG